MWRIDLSISVRDVAPLSHEVFDHSMELGTLIAQLAVTSRSACLTSAESL
jgi:hypothetical protein